ncbi:MAG: D-sedoheptulose 7-phosphate isomerase [Nitrospina sp.]|nr:MAG: D-sedoheptulose 7-phosphate isomerase [Nitrospina sp.]TDJ59200.1 MAG: D-sedoheptulose 7-phosphate isomerase [Nitrospina sp.]
MQQIKDFLNESARLKQTVAETLAGDIQKAIELIRASLQKGGKLLLMGNGGSAGDCQHIAAELVGRYKRERKAVPAIALTVDTSILTALGNDYGFEYIFSRQVEALAGPDDVVMGISTSGNSENVIRALQAAQSLGAATVALLGNQGGKMKDLADVAIVVPSSDTARIQECHITIGHIICEILEKDF